MTKLIDKNKLLEEISFLEKHSPEDSNGTFFLESSVLSIIENSELIEVPLPVQQDPSKVLVSKEALRRILTALNGPPHLISEIQVTRNIAKLLKEENPIDTLINDYNNGIK